MMIWREGGGGGEMQKASINEEAAYRIEEATEAQDKVQTIVAVMIDGGRFA